MGSRQSGGEMPSGPEALAETLRELVGGRLRALGTYAGEEHSVAFVREDVEPKADAERIERIHEELVLGSIGGGYQERLFELGGLRATARHFEQGVVLHVPGPDYEGVFVSLDAAAADRAGDVIEACRAHLPEGGADGRPLLRGAG